MAQDNPDWGQLRIAGELKGVGIIMSPRTVAAILNRNGIKPMGPNGKRVTSQWREFLAGHAHEIVASDFFTADVWGWLGQRGVYVLFGIHLETRRVEIFGVTEHPTEAFMQQVGRNLTQEGGWLMKRGAKYFIHDRDTKYCESFRHILDQSGIEPLPIPANKPNLNGVFRALGEDREARAACGSCACWPMLGCGELCRNLMIHYHGERPHQGLKNQRPVPAQKVDRGAIRCRRRLGGVLKHYYRIAA